MRKFYGKTAHKGLAIGPIAVLKKEDPNVVRSVVDSSEKESKRVLEAIQTAQDELQKLYEKALTEVGENGAAIFYAHKMLLEDTSFQDAILARIRTEPVNAEYAVSAAGEFFVNVFSQMDDPYMKERAADIQDLTRRLVRILDGRKEVNQHFDTPVILIAEDLTPGETIQMDTSKILAFVTIHGSVNSHAAILARMKNIPALTGVPLDLTTLKNGSKAIVDGERGELILEPDACFCKETEQRIAEENEQATLLKELKGKENITLSGYKMDIFANISRVEDVDSALQNDAGGIGLFRSEFLYLGRDTAPSEEEQLRAYQSVLKAMGEKKVMIRTIDLGSDKRVDYLNLEKEENPALGFRGIRICFKQPDIFKTQLRALFRAAVSGNLSILYPMITSVEEVRRIFETVEEVRRELWENQIPFQIPKQGIMIETPAAVMLSEELAQMVDFFSIGTNDLTQYTLAVDRQNESLSDYYDPDHKAILRMIRIAADHAHKYGKRVGICGEAAADPELTEQFVKMGIDELSVSPSMILPLRKHLRTIS